MSYPLPCPFCQQYTTTKDAMIFYCAPCQTTYWTGLGNPELNIKLIGYALNDPQLTHMTMHLITNETAIWTVCPTRQIRFPSVWPKTKPKDALALAKRLMSMKAFL